MRFVYINVAFRSQQKEYLQKLAIERESSVSQALRGVIDRFMREYHTKIGAPDKERTNVVLQPRHVTFLDQRAGEMGIARSDLVRRLVDEAAKSTIAS